MAIFGFGKEKTGQDDSPQVLAYLEDAYRQRSPFVLKAPGQPEVAAQLHSVEEEARTFRLLPERDLKVDKGGKVEFTLIHDGLRIGGSTRAAETRQGVVVLHFPGALALMERRRQPRARINPKEGATLTALQDILAGVGINSSIDNISEGGARVRVDRAITIATEKRLVLGINLVPVGQVFVMLKLNKVPKCPPVLETKGKAVYLAHDSAQLIMGFAFDKPPQEVASALGRLVTARSRPFPSVLPPKARRLKEPEKEEAEASAPPEPPVAEALPVAAPAPGPAEVSGADQPIPENRVHLRLSLGPGFKARFLSKGEPIADADMLDISIGGCCLRMPPEACKDLLAGALLEDFHFLHRDLPNGALQARVKWILGKNALDRPGAADERYCLVGISFSDPAPEVIEGLEAYIAWHIEIPN